ncbi:methionine--tRNA ligase [Candidatus Falkowbacteria bacterium RIFOXYB2_FULL_38_15]|uniref:Methionine--tRNA ligase n=1 Tax=Candidatus Falkowbacteria bacterium RIFOXYA2_FULL_38_12 TaxID=1797993 RepID=A0A1F5S238_9BACT|nr:MAG: methionine--tRNA ligase [Candidatus Falkowbacteria bacterium RIFOXYA2_FULL_38_12]OGF32530.1 MAG: methionine--tRNA ligase [Candidatus Falkowbacteria bacterium RIFOXYB2_FULL_38_15]OGF42004.1 MAG: methionine--tRNA ligase [Candidatus Falkowbacteria bacterium RIFOXYD2_FULL_39_16]
MKNKFYITTTLPYVNADPHIGFAREILEADVLARFYRLLGDEVFFNTGTDEHGLKIHRKAEELGQDTQAYCDLKAKIFLELKEKLNLSFDNFIRTTDENHKKAVKEFWKRSLANGDIYKKMYKIKYCVGCELEKTESELVEGKCPLHPNMDLEAIEEENYFFRFSKYQDQLLELYKNNPEFVVPQKRMNEIRSFVEGGLDDFSISRLKKKMPWGVPVPDDQDHVMYVWFDALVNYISAIGWPEDMKKFNKWWPVVQLCGKDNLRQQSAMWQAMLMSVGISASKQIFVNGFINVGGQKMSKSLGNVISPLEMVEKFGIDGARYLLLNSGVFGEDTDLNWEILKEKYNADLANGVGNLVARTLAMCEKYFDGKVPQAVPDINNLEKKWKNCEEAIKVLSIHEAIGEVNGLISACDKFINEEAPWKLAKNDVKKLEEVIYILLETIRHISWMVAPFMPETADKIFEQLGLDLKEEKEKSFKEAKKWGGLKAGTVIKRGEGLFPRIE